MTEDKHEHSPQHEELLQAQQLKQHEVAEVLNFIKKYAKMAGAVILFVLLFVMTDSFFKSRRYNKETTADQLLLKAQNADAYKAIADNYKSTPAGPVAMMGLAKEYYNAANYDAAEKLFQEFMDKHPTHEMAPLAELNLIACKEARGHLGDAHLLYSDFAEKHKNTYLAPVAIMAKARCLEALGQFAEAQSAYEDLMIYYPDSSWDSIAQANLKALKNKQ
ncbi:MAG: tetratricopeptide repeat protein [Kiritimatiellales bacterium]|nr:tetratricopeptide repeat protein [Kiritimatiellales bacterium]